MENTKKYTWHEARELMTKFNEEHGITSECSGEQLIMVAVIKAESFDKPYTEAERSYAFSNNNNAFLPNKISNAIYSNCLDGKDFGVRLDWYIPQEWKVDYCYIKEN